MAHLSRDEAQRQDAENLLAFLTPICKAFMTETGLEVTNHGMQVFGGHGFIREWGMEQLVRDCRIAPIYEGTNGIQALDLLGRKVLGSKASCCWALPGLCTSSAARMPSIRSSRLMSHNSMP